jgi:hypothetical protein
MFIAFIVVVLVLSVVAAIELRFRRRKAREAHIRNFRFPKGVYAKVIKLHPQLSLRDMELVGAGLRQFFLAYSKSGEQYVSMPSQVADDLWHEFILYTKNYQEFNRRAFNKFLHHTPAAAVSSNAQSNAGLHRCWQVLCKEENINPLKASRMPLLFALDTKFNIVGGFHYVPDCSGVQRQGDKGEVHCGVALGAAALIGSDDGDSSWWSSSGSSSSSDSGGDSGGDSSGGDSGCGGGGCGGGD